MCGIFFSIGFEDLPPAVIDSVAHRGPDGRGWNSFTSPQGPVVMAHRRLAIIDLSEDGHQPMSFEGRYWITYNGEIYNYREIRQDLENLGHPFTTETDTEVLLKAYLQWGEACLHRFNGMFAFVIWDDQEKKAFAARDRFGVKPLYVYQQAGKTAFASEIKQFKHISGWRSRLNKELASEYLQKGHCDHRVETLYEDVSQILAGQAVIYDLKLPLVKVFCWYDLKKHMQPKKRRDPEAIEEFRALFEDAVRLRLRADVPVGACLSGGTDSTSIVSMMDKIGRSPQQIHTFSAMFSGHEVDESSYIEKFVSEKGVKAHRNYPSAEGFLEDLDAVLFYQDLPFSGTSIFAQWKTFESAHAAKVTVLLDGQGADESLLGYPRMLNSIIFSYGHL